MRAFQIAALVETAVRDERERGIIRSKPLTNEEIEKILVESAGMTVQFSAVDLRFARAIERAHGIKENL